MPATSNLDSLLMLRLRTLHSSLCEQSAKVSTISSVQATHDRLIHLVILPALIRPGPLSSLPPDPAATRGPTPPPTPGIPWFARKRALMRQARGLGESAARLFKIIGLIKGAWGFWTIVAPTLLWAATAAWKGISPWLRWLWQLAAGS